MYVFYFNTRRGSEDVQVSKAEIERKIDDLYHVTLDPNGGIKKKYFFVPIEEGKICQRSFWLKDLDYEKAEQMINDYEKSKYLRAKKLIEKMERKLKKEES